MKVSLNWLREFVDIKMPVEKLADKIALSTVEVDEIIDFGKLFKGVFVGEIKSIGKHPNADNLSVAQVSFGKRKCQIVFGGGLTLKVGQKLPFVIAPAVLPNGMVIERRNLRGVESQGMIASNKEMGLDYNGDEITFFDSKVKVGTPLAKALSIEDIVLDLDVLSNRPDLFSHIGVAREIAAITGKKMKHPELVKPKEDTEKINRYLEVEVRDKKLCPRYEARFIKNVKIGPSPLWIKNKLIALGLRPVNNVVDVTNFVMMELGQPLHAFDADTLSGGKKKKVIVRLAKSGEEIKTLDDKKRRLTKDILLIADSKKAIGIAGVMGGKDTEVNEKTQNIILEAANFNWVSIRKAARILGLRSDAVTRFEKGLDPEMTSHALDRAADLISKIASGKILGDKIDINNALSEQKDIEISLEKIAKTLGKDFSHQKIVKALESLGIKSKIEGSILKTIIPTFRRDLNKPIDIIEEVARMIGFDNIPTSVPVGEIVSPEPNKELNFTYRLKDFLAGLGFNEIYTYTFVGEDTLKTFGDKPNSYLELKNPLKPEHSYLRQNLIYSMVEASSLNAKNFPEFSMFEIAKVFHKTKAKMPDEIKRLAMALYGEGSFFKLKGVIEEIARYLNASGFVFEPLPRQVSYLHPNRSAEILINGKKIGFLGDLHPRLADKFNFKNDFTVCELDFLSLLKSARDDKYEAYSKYPLVLLDISIIVDERVKEAEIRSEIKKNGKGLISKVELFDVYRGSQIKVGEKSLAYHIYYQSEERTLTEEEVKEINDKILAKLKNKFKASQRS